KMYELVREAANECGRAVAVLADLQGPKIRLGRFPDGPYGGPPGDLVTIPPGDIVGPADRVSCTYRKLPQEVRVGDRLLIDDGRVAIEVLGVEGNDIRSLVVEGGPPPT